MNKKIAVVNGDGVGPEVTQQAIKVLDAVADMFGHEFDYDPILLGTAAIAVTNEAMPADSVDAAVGCDAILAGPLNDTKNPGNKTDFPVAQFKAALGLHTSILLAQANTSLAHLSPLKPKHFEKLDCIIYKNVSDNPSENAETVRLAFDMATRRGKNVSYVYAGEKAAIEQPLLTSIQAISPAYKSVTVTKMSLGKAVAQIMQQPASFDIVIADDTSADVLNQQLETLLGAANLLAKATISTNAGFFEPVHGTFLQAAGKDIANPIGAIMAAAMMLDFFALHKEANMVRSAVKWTLNSGFATRDIDPINYYYSSTIADLVVDYIYGKIPDAVNKNNIELRKSTII